MRRLALAVAFFCVLNVLALCALGGYAWSRGWLTRDRVLAAVEVFRNGVPAVDSAAPASNQPAAQQAATSQPAESVAERIRLNDEMDAVHRIELERREREIRNLWSHLENRELALLREKEEFDAMRARFAEEQAALARASGSDGLQKELDILSSLPPKDAKRLLSQKQDADAVQIIRKMDQRRVAKIVKECKTDVERQWIGRILEKLHDGDVAQAEVLGAVD